MSKTPAQSERAHCADLVRTFDYARYATALFAPAEHRDALLALYAFNVEIARVREQVTQPLAGEIRLQWWDDVLAGKPAGEAGGHPVASRLLDVIDVYQLSKATLSELVAAHRFGLYDEPIQTVAELEGYLDETAGKLFTIAARIQGERSPLLQAVAHHAALAYGAMTVIDALPREASRKRLLVPVELLTRFGAKPESIFAGKASPELCDVVRALADGARTHLAEAMSLLPDINPFARSGFLVLALIPPRLRQVAKVGYDPFKLPPRSRLRRLWTIWRASRSWRAL